ncbi:hypothetical protein [Reichenbachiella ulvae]|uniref:Uncharacterized protein n=1 Tax=Reichenbachiella ulvae TaxID=2980104 RepID=A0ABT3CYG0_9BACT|nr:hypothetical protein [Reichenbachiella ulvae]MCV9388606.1 hypothetical protein [Reichenbachiella ulvae]
MHGSKLNPQATSQYANTYSQKILDDFFQEKEGITGQEIISLTPIKQVNFFVLKVLFEEWQEETKKFKSPYFDYRNEEVNTALKTLVNTLSKHILIQKDDFHELLTRAVEQTLVWLYDPTAFLLEEAQKLEGKDICKELKAESKYIKVYKDLYDSILNNLESGVSTDKAVVQSVMKNAVGNYKEDPAEREEVETFFNAVVPLDVFKTDEPIPAKVKPEPEVEAVTEEEDSFFDSLEELPEIEQEEETKPEPKEDKPLSEGMNEQFEPEVAPRKKTEPLAKKIASTNPSSPNLNEQFAGEDIQTLNQRFEEKETIASQLESKPTEELTRSISINQRYMFVNDLFEGNEKDYEKALYQMETSKSFDASVELLVQSYAKKYTWDMNSDEVKELLKVIFKRFR